MAPLTQGGQGRAARLAPRFRVNTGDSRQSMPVGARTVKGSERQVAYSKANRIGFKLLELYTLYVPITEHLPPDWRWTGLKISCVASTVPGI